MKRIFVTGMPPIRREIGAALAFKAVALAVLYFAFFSGPRHEEVTPSRMAASFFGSDTPTAFPK